MGFCGSKGMPFLLQVMRARASAASAALPGQSFWPHIHQQQVRIGPPRDERQPGVGQGGGEDGSVLHHAPGVRAERRPQRLAQRHRFAGHDVHQRPALDARKDRGVDPSGDRLVVGQHQPPSRPAQGLVGRGGHRVGVGQRVGVEAGGDQSGRSAPCPPSARRRRRPRSRGSGHGRPRADMPTRRRRSAWADAGRPGVPPRRSRCASRRGGRRTARSGTTCPTGWAARRGSGGRRPPATCPAPYRRAGAAR